MNQPNLKIIDIQVGKKTGEIGAVAGITLMVEVLVLIYKIIGQEWVKHGFDRGRQEGL